MSLKVEMYLVAIACHILWIVLPVCPFIRVLAFYSLFKRFAIFDLPMTDGDVGIDG